MSIRLVNYKCTKCNYITKDILFRNQFTITDVYPCKKCGSPSKKLFSAPYFYLKEGYEPTSSKPSSYWRNAETVRLARKKEKEAKQKEKEFYGDKDTVARKERIQANLEARKKANESD